MLAPRGGLPSTAQAVPAAFAADGVTCRCDNAGVQPSTSIRFAAAAAVIARAARARGLAAPSFRSPPRRRGAVRTIQRAGDGTTTVAVAMRGRPWSVVLADMIEGVVVGNRLTGRAAAACREALWSALEDDAQARAA